MNKHFTYKLMIAVTSVLLILTSLWQLLISDTYTDGWANYVLVIIVFWCAIYLFTTYKHFRSVYLFSSVYIVCLLVFHAGHLVLDVFGVVKYVQYHSGPMAFWLESAGWCTILSLGSLGIGLSLSFTTNVHKKPNEPIDLQLYYSNLYSTYWIGIGLLIASGITLIIAFISIGNIFAYTRTELFGNIGDVRGFGYFIVVCPSALILITVSATNKKKKILAYSFSFFVAIALLAMGYRSSVLFALVIGAVVWVKIGKIIPTAVPVVFFILVFITIPTVRYLRDMGPVNKISSDKITESIKTSELKETLQELGGTDYIVAYVLKTIPKEEPFRMGRSYLWGLKVLVPNIGFRQSDTYGRESSGNKLLVQKKLFEGNPSDWFIYKTNRWKFNEGLGSGFSSIGETYLNFGFFGILIGFSLLGFVLGKIDHCDLKRNFYILIISGGFLWPLIKTVRNSFGVFVKPLGLILTTILIWRILTFWKKHKKRHRLIVANKAIR